MRAKAIAWAFGLSCLLGTLVACGGGGTTQEVSSQQVVLKGRVLGAGAVAVDQALVSVGNISTATLTDGSFELSVPASASSTVVLVKKPGFGTTAKKVPLATGRVTELTLQLFPDQLITSFSAAVGISATPGGATVTIAPNSVQTSAGAPYTGTVQIAASYQDPQSVSGVQAFAQPYASADGALLQSVGVIEVKLTDSSGNALQLRPGTPATLVYPDNAIAGSATMVPLWHYDETQRIWVREGSATRRADGNYEGQVSHFTLWNADFPYVDNTTVRGCFQDASGNPVPQVLATVWSLGWEISGGSGPDGRFETRVISGVPLELKSWNVPPAFAPVAIPALAPNEVRQLACVVVDPTALLGPWVIPTTIATFTATLPSGTTTTPPRHHHCGLRWNLHRHLRRR